MWPTASLFLSPNTINTMHTPGRQVQRIWIRSTVDVFKLTRCQPSVQISDNSAIAEAEFEPKFGHEPEFEFEPEGEFGHKAEFERESEPEDRLALLSKRQLQPHHHATPEACLRYVSSHPGRVSRCRCGRWRRPDGQLSEQPRRPRCSSIRLVVQKKYTASRHGKLHKPHWMRRLRRPRRPLRQSTQQARLRTMTDNICCSDKAPPVSGATLWLFNQITAQIAYSSGIGHVSHQLWCISAPEATFAVNQHLA